MAERSKERPGREIKSKADPFRRLKRAAVLAAGLALLSCGDRASYTNDAGPGDTGPEAALSLCSEDESVVSAEGRELTLEVGDSAVFPSLSKLTLVDVLDDRGSFDVIDQDGAVLHSLDMRLEMEYTFGTSGQDITAAVCSLDSGASATVRSDQAISLDEAPCLTEIVDDVQTHGREFPAGSGTMTITERSEVDCHGDPTLLSQRVDFDPAIRYSPEREVLIDPGRYQVIFMGEEYLLTIVDLTSIELSREAAGGPINIGDEMAIAGGLGFRLTAVNGRGTLAQATIEVVDAGGEVQGTHTIPVCGTQDIVVGDSVYGIHLYSANPDFGWADVGVLSERRRVSDGDRLEYRGAVFAFRTMWGPAESLSGWVLNRDM